MVRVYPVPGDAGRSISRLSFYFDREMLAAEPALLQTRAEIFGSVIESEDYATAENAQRALQSGLLKYVIFGRNEAPLHHYT